MDVSALHNEENLAIFNHRDTDAELLKFIQEGLSLHTMIRDETDKKEKKNLKWTPGSQTRPTMKVEGLEAT